ncbi:MAG: dihydropteroate synthase [Clostridiales bacterium]|nr:dihydropteroate synthase [Clostridiales bacterium]
MKDSSTRVHAVLEELREGFLLFDGAMGTMLQQRGVGPGQLPELLNLSDPELVTDIHREYVAAGCQVITANTFGANALKLADSGYTVDQVVSAGIACAKAAGAPYVALDLGPTGQLLQPMGTLSFEEAYQLYAEQVTAGLEAGADLILIETISDLYEAKAAILAAREQSDLPVFCTLTFEEGQRTFIGADPLTAAVALNAWGVDALGVNCSLGPNELLPVVESLLEYAKIPVMVQANAGLPREEAGRTVYDISPESYAAAVERMLDTGVRIVGGCCGTTPVYMKRLHELLEGRKPVAVTPRRITACCSGTTARVLDGRISVIGERINPTGKKRLKEALREGRMDYIIGEAIDQTAAGADLLDINVGLPELDEPRMLAGVIREVQGVTALPLQIDSSDPAAIEAGVRCYCGKPVINSVNGKKESMEQIFPIVKKYGALVVGLTLDEGGIPPTAEERFAIAKRIWETAKAYGIPEEDLLIDCLVLTASAQQDQVLETLKAIKLVKSRLGLKTVLGVSNVSFGLPARPLLNSVYLAAAFGAGLDAPILNPLSPDMMRVVDTFRVLNGEDRDAAAYIERYADFQTDGPAAAPPTAFSDGSQDTAAAFPGPPAGLTLYDCIVQGRKDEAGEKVKALLQEQSALQIIDEQFVPALDYVGDRFEKGKIFLPQLMQSAQAVKTAFAIIKEAQTGEKQAAKGKILLATVQGDIHDIGKNIVKMMLENYGYDVVDLGKDVPVEQVVEETLRQDIRLVGLSALMTTTVKNMQETIEALRRAGAGCKVMVGGAVLNEEYAKMVGADYYAKDAQASVRIAAAFFGE